MSYLTEAYGKIQDSIPGVKVARDFTEEMEGYYDDRLDEVEGMVGYNPYIHSPNEVYDDLGGRPAPLDPNQYPTWEELDAIRHYYGPQLVSEHFGGGIPGGAASVVYPAIHEVEGLVQGHGMAQIAPDFYNNLVSAYDEFTGKDKFPATGLLGRLKKGMPTGEFGAFAKHALSRTKVPPVYEGE